MVKKLFSITLRLGVSLILLTFLFYQIDRKGFLSLLKDVNPGFLTLAFLMMVFSYTAGLFRWGMLFKGVDMKLPFKRILSGFCAGVFFNLFMPSTIGGDLVRSVDLARQTQKPKEVIATVFLDRLSGYVGLVVMAVVALSFGYDFIKDRSVILTVSIISGILAFTLLVLFNNYLFTKVNNLLSFIPRNKLRQALSSLHQQIYYFRKQKTMLFNNLLLSLLIQVMMPLVFYFTAKALGVEIKLIYFLIFVPLISAITLLPISIGGLGLRDATTVFFFAKVGLAKNVSLALSLINFIFIFIIGCIGGIIYVFTLHTRRL